MSTQRIFGIEAVQLRTLGNSLAKVRREAAIALYLTDAGVLHVRIDHPDNDRRTWLAVDIDAEVLPGSGPPAPPRPGDVDRDVR
jgi:hypothetical protein